MTRWKQEVDAEAHHAFGGSGNPRNEEVVRLKRELARVKKERDFLRDAAAFFAREST
jgi:transposase